MQIAQLLARLRNEASVFVAEERRLQDGTVVYILGAHVAFFPLAPRNVWCTLIQQPGFDFVEEEEVESILRRFWHGEIDVQTWINGTQADQPK
jgi:hypothetical protein